MVQVAEGCAPRMAAYIQETPEALARTLSCIEEQLRRLPAAAEKRLAALVLTGCGSGYHAARIGQYPWADRATVPVWVVPSAAIAYEGGLPRHLTSLRTLVVALSRSGEKADTLEAVRCVRRAGAMVWAITAQGDSTLASLSDQVLTTAEGPEAAQPKTKSVLATVLALQLAGAYLTGGSESPRRLSEDLRSQSSALRSWIGCLPERLTQVVATLSGREHVLIAGHGVQHAIAEEVALKLKETAGIHAESLHLGEMMQGPTTLLGPEWAYIGLPGPATATAHQRIARVAAGQGSSVLTVDPQGASGEDPWTVAGAGPFPTWMEPYFTLPVFQQLACSVSLARHRDPDNPPNFDAVLDLILEPGRTEPENR